jgi:hypothetical protein
VYYRDDDLSSNSVLRRAQALIVFIGDAIHHSGSALGHTAVATAIVRKLISQLLALSSSDLAARKELAGVTAASRAALEHALSKVSASEFLRSILIILNSGSDTASLPILIPKSIADFSPATDSSLATPG